MRRTLLSLAAIVFLCQTARAVDTIPVVKTLADLAAVPEITVRTGVYAKVGMSDSPTDFGPSRWLYAIVRTDETDKSDPAQKFSELPLGPLAVRVSFGDQQKAQDISKQLVDRKKHVGSRLFCQLVQLRPMTSNTIKISLADDQPAIFETKIDPVADQPCYWADFVYPHGKQQPQELPKEGQRVAWTDTEPCRAGPKFDEISAIKDLDGPLDMWLAQLPMEAGKLSLSLDGNVFVIDPRGTAVAQPPKRHLLARWWVNDKPIEMKREIKMIAESEQALQQMDSKKPVRIKFGLPTDLGQLKPGDRVGVQVMFVEEYQWLFGGKMQQLLAMQRPRSAMPMISNRLDFVVTAEQVSSTQPAK